MPIRRAVPEFSAKAPNKKLQAKVKNFLVNIGVLDRKGFVLDHNTTVEFEEQSRGVVDFNIYKAAVFAGAYTATLRRIDKHAIFTYTESYSKPVNDFLQGWTNYIAQVTAEDQMEVTTLEG